VAFASPPEQALLVPMVLVAQPSEEDLGFRRSAACTHVQPFELVYWGHVSEIGLCPFTQPGLLQLIEARYCFQQTSETLSVLTPQMAQAVRSQHTKCKLQALVGISQIRAYLSFPILAV